MKNLKILLASFFVVFLCYALAGAFGESQNSFGVTVPAGVVGSSTALSDSGGVLTLQNVDVIDSTTETTIETAIDTLANLGSIGSDTGLIKATSGNLSFITDGTTNWDAAHTHVSSNGSDHTYINQDVTSSGAPTFSGATITNSASFFVGASTPFSDSAGVLTLQNVDVIDSTTETTIESAIDTLANVTSFTSSGNTIWSIATGVDQATAGAVAGELWADSNDEYTIKLGQ